MNVMTIGIIATCSKVDRRLFHSLDADKISYAARRPIRHTMVMMLISETPNVENMLTADDVALDSEDVVLKMLSVLVVLIELIVLSMEDSICLTSYFKIVSAANV